MVGHIAVVSNPSAGKGRGRASAEVALARLRDLHGDVRAYEGASAADSRTLVVAALAARPDALVIVGGDGTLSTVLDLVCAEQVPIALVPSGTGNDLARALSLPGMIRQLQRNWPCEGHRARSTSARCTALGGRRCS